MRLRACVFVALISCVLVEISFVLVALNESSVFTSGVEVDVEVAF